MMNNNNSNIPHHQPPWGLTFNPTDEDLMRYLRAKVDNIQLPFVDPIFEFDVFTQDHPLAILLAPLAAEVVRRVEQVGRPLCFLTKKISKFSHPFVSPMQYQWLLILSYADDQILAIETVVEKCFPFATHVLDKLDTVVAVDNAIDELSTMIHRKVSILSLALMQWRLILDFLICTLTDWNCDEVKEKEIRVDTNCNERVELGARKALVDVQDESELIMIDSSHSEDTIEES
ncbi:hypothetical protein Syun_019727 [Stephania yunnanensis]|uniref:NAC domain-containing protein n=1 Tax=Stephania yunnanensis TaxID=152371 RepID=A0AAP0NY85_9MAGN